ncbi:hypothetical protein GN244_ATG01819 [Phytophthora infestans]|uniref:Uncharacterized protein n=1 Tax=Phytophthora infestans TaxID=4787 RepID=A0A833TDD7_PHYIN|nr:hypothetical protein GN244_ATG01819 [Phytophthora infestans]
MEVESDTTPDDPHTPLARPEIDASSRIARRKHYSFRIKRAVLEGAEGISLRAQQNIWRPASNTQRLDS